MATTHTNRPLAVAIIGSGPSGFYAAEALLKNKETPARVDMFDRLATPYGLVRGGVAPDHQSIKAVTRVYEKVAAQGGFRFFGNVQVGRDITVSDLLEHYDSIIYAVGNEDSRGLGITGENLKGVIPSGRFVGWFNGHPDYVNENYNLDRVKAAAVIGNGNVAVDAVRILAKTHAELATTDIADHALEQLGKSTVQDVYMIGRRGPVQAQFTPGETRELGEMEHADMIVDAQDLVLDEKSKQALEAGGPRSHMQQNMDRLQEFAARPRAGHAHRVHFRFLQSPVEVLGDDQGRVRALRIERNRLVERDGNLAAKGTGEFEELPVQLVVVAAGFRGVALPGVPFDEKRGLIPNKDGRVTDVAGAVLPRQFVVGWAQTGPRGLIGSHKAPSGEVAGLLLADAKALTLGDGPANAESIVNLLKSRNVRFVSFAEWKRLDEIEVQRGKERGAPRRKFVRIDDMLGALK